MESEVAREQVRELIIASTYGIEDSCRIVSDEELFRQALALGAALMDLDELSELLFSVPWEPDYLLLVLAGSDRERASTELALWLCDTLEDEIEGDLRPQLLYVEPDLLRAIERGLALAREVILKKPAAQGQLNAILAPLHKQLRQKERAIEALQKQLESPQDGPLALSDADRRLLAAASWLAAGAPLADAQKLDLLRDWAVLRTGRILRQIKQAPSGIREGDKPLNERFKARARRLLAPLYG